MAATTNVDQLVRRLEAIGPAMEAAQRTVAQRSGELVRASTERNIMAATGGDGVLSGMTRTTGGRSKRPPRPIRVRSRVERRGTGWQAFVKASGPMPLIERDVDRHIVVSRHAQGATYTRTTKTGKTRTGRSTRQSRVASVAFGLGAAGGGRRAVLHWGDNYARYTFASSKGRHPWRRGVDQAAPQFGQIQAEAQRAAIRQALR